MKLNRIFSFVYFSILGRMRAWFWQFFLKIQGGRLGRNARLYESVRINCGRPESIFIGDNLSLLRGATISTHTSGKITIGNRVHIGEYSIVTSDGEIVIGDDVTVGPHTVIVDLDHRYDQPDCPLNQQGFHCEKIMIENDVWIASNCTILKGVTIGAGAIIGAGAVVTRNISPNSIAVGVPAREIKKRPIDTTKGPAS